MFSSAIQAFSVPFNDRFARVAACDCFKGDVYLYHDLMHGILLVIEECRTLGERFNKQHLNVS